MAEWRRVELVAGSGRRVLADLREGPGPTLLLLAGTWGNAATRGPLVQRLDPDLTLICATLAGQDDNWPPPTDPSIRGFAEDVKDLADALGVTRFFAGGNSLGGMIAIELLRSAGERLAGVISIEGWTHWRVAEEAFGGDLSSTLDDAQRELLGDVRRKLLARWGPTDRERFGSMWQQWDGWELLASTHVPVLEIWGDRGRARPTRAAMRIPQRANIEPAWIAGASHSLLIEAPRRLAELIDAFVRRGGGSGASG